MTTRSRIPKGETADDYRMCSPTAMWRLLGWPVPMRDKALGWDDLMAEAGNRYLMAKARRGLEAA